MANPIQLQVGNGYIANFNPVKFSFRVPDVNNDNTGNEALSGGTLPIIYWSLSSGNGSDVLYASGSYIIADDIKKINCSSYCDWTIYDKNGINLSGTESQFEPYFENNCGIGSGCVLKLSIINDLELTSGVKIPFLEYKITGLGDNFPDRFTSIRSSGKAYGYQKDLEISVPQETVNQAFDFTVFQ